jgi:hypothetical protein
MFDLSAAKNPDLAAILRALQERTGIAVGPASLIARMKRADLISKIEEQCAAGSLAIADDGSVAPGSVPEAGEPSAAPSEAPLAAPVPEVEVVGTFTRTASQRVLLQPDDWVITVLVENSRREGSVAHARFSLLQTGQTVAEFIAAVVAATGSDHRARSTLRKAVRRGEISVAAP